jgi:hypothetical protein
MKFKNLLFVILCISSANVFAQFENNKQMYSAKNLKEVIATHKTVAILPLNATISYKRPPKDYDPEANKFLEQKMGLNMQQGMYTYLLRKSDDYSVSFQDVQRTNALLKKAGVFDKIDEQLPDDLCKILGVDAVIKSSYSYEKTVGSETGAIVKALVFGSAGSTASGDLILQVYNGTDGNLVWRFYKQMNEGLFTDANELMVRMMAKVSRNFPYAK